MVRDGHAHGVAYFDLIPPNVRHLGPWVGGGEGDVADLKTRYRLQLMTEGFLIVNRPVTRFEPEVPTRKHVVARPSDL